MKEYRKKMPNYVVVLIKKVIEDASQIDLDENILHGGGALSDLPTKHWTISGTYDADVTKSDDRARSVTRHRVGVSATLAF